MNLRPPRDGPAFERLARDVIGRVLGDIHVDLYGRSGQTQTGIDILAVERSTGAVVGVQCKGRSSTEGAGSKPLSERELRAEVAKVSGYPGQLDRLVILTSGPNDARLKAVASELTIEHRREGRFEVVVHAWDWIEGHLHQHVDLAVKHQLVAPFPSPQTSMVAQEIGGRLRRAIELMNDDRSDADRFTLPSLAAHLNHKDWRRLEQIIAGVADAPASELGSLAEALGLNAAWLMEGKHAPFQLDPADSYVPIEELFQRLSEMRPRTISFVRADGEDFDAIVVLERDDVRWFVWRTDFPVSERVGATGRRQMLDLCALIRRFDVTLERGGVRLTGTHLSHQDFQSLLEGEVYPGRHLRWRRNDHWWEDFSALKAEEVPAEKPRDVQLKRAIEITQWELERVKGSRLRSHWADDFLRWGCFDPPG